MLHTRPISRRIQLAATVLAAGGLLLTGCTSQASTPAPAPESASDTTADFLADHDLAGLDAAGIIERLDTMPVSERPTDLIASVQPDSLALTDTNEREVALPIEGDEMYLSIAPYREQTHDCYFHSLTTCLGELGNTEVSVKLTDFDGTVLLDETRTSNDNGFIGIWVPRDVDANLTVTLGDESATTQISTRNSDDPTCITNMQLR